jgi:hypothetical protein
MTITGSYYKMPVNNFFMQNAVPDVYNRYNTYYSDPSESMSLGLNYKIAKGFYFGAQVILSNGYQPSLNPIRVLPLLQDSNPYNTLYW